MAYDDYEQSEQVRNWLRENAMSIIGGVGLGLLLIFGAHQWRNHQAKHRTEAAANYQALVQAVADDNQADIDRLLGELQDQYKDTPFAVFASLGAAQRALQAGDAQRAETALAWAAQHADGDALKWLVVLRQARVALAAGNPDATLAKLATLPPDAYRGMAEELRGDALVALDRSAEARTAYSAALAANGDSAPQNRLLQLKLDNIAVADAVAADAAPEADPAVTVTVEGQS